MKRKTILTIILCSLSLLIFPCSAVTKNDGENVIFGGNLDWANPYTQVKFAPGENGKNGVIYFGHSLDQAIQGLWGVNDKGLVVTSLSTPYKKIKRSIFKKDYIGHINLKILEECNTVEEAIKLVNKFEKGYLTVEQLFIADKSGKSIIIDGTKNIEREENFQIVTNFMQSEKKIKNAPCYRYRAISKNIDKVPLNVSGFEQLLELAKQSPSGQSPTIVSFIADLNKMELNLYHFGDFNNKITFNIEKELNKPAKKINLYDVLPNQNQEKFLTKYKYLKPKVKDSSLSFNPDDYTGTYDFKFNHSMKIDVRKEDNQLFVYYGEMKSNMIPFDKDKFYFDKQDFLIIFLRDKNNKIKESIVKHDYYGDISGRKI